MERMNGIKGGKSLDNLNGFCIISPLILFNIFFMPETKSILPPALEDAIQRLERSADCLETGETSPQTIVEVMRSISAQIREAAKEAIKNARASGDLDGFANAASAGFFDL